MKQLLKYLFSITLVIVLILSITTLSLGTQVLIRLTENVKGILGITNGGNGTASPTLTAGSNMTVSGSWPNYTLSASVSGIPQSYQISDGTNYYMVWPSYKVTQPNPASFSWLNQAGATEAQYGPALLLTMAGSTIRIPSTRYMSIGTNTTLDAAIVPVLYGENSLLNQDPAACTFFYEAASTHMVAICAGWHPTSHTLQIFVNYYTNTTTWNSVLATSGTRNFSSNYQYVLLRLQISGANVLYQVSPDAGINWDTILSEAKTAHFTTAPDNWGYGLIAPNGTSYAVLASWKTS